MVGGLPAWSLRVRLRPLVGPAEGFPAGLRGTGEAGHESARPFAIAWPAGLIWDWLAAVAIPVYPAVYTVCKRR